MKSRCIISLKLPWFLKINRNAQWGLEAHSIFGWFILCDLFIVTYVSHTAVPVHLCYCRVTAVPCRFKWLSQNCRAQSKLKLITLLRIHARSVVFTYLCIMHFSPCIYAHVSNRIMGLKYATNLRHAGARSRRLI